MMSIPTARLVEPLTIVITTQNQVNTLRRHLPAILSQDYDEYEVIVVDTGSTDETLPLLKALELEYVHLRHLSTPTSARDISLERLALTLGIRAAKSEWVVLTEADCEPASSHWLTILSKSISTHRDADIIMGFSRYEEQNNSWYDRRIGFHRLWHQLANYTHIQSGHRAVRGDGCNVAIRKQAFLDGGGFGAQNLRCGACELLVNKLSTPDNTRLCLAPDATMIQDKPSPEAWRQHQVIYMETRRHQHHTALYRMRNTISLAWPWFELCCMAIPFIMGIVGLCLSLQWEDSTYLHPFALLRNRPSYMPNADAPSTSEVVIFCLFLLLLLLLMSLISSLRIRQFNQRARALGCRRYRLTYVVCELCMPFWALAAWLRHRFTGRNEFRKKFV